MRSVVLWQDKVPERDNIKNVVYDIAFRPDGTQLVAAVGNRVLVYDATDGDLLHSLKGHKETVYCCAYSKDGKRFASGGADNTIIIWTHKAEGILKYTHNESIQCMAYNPVGQMLASCTAVDFGLWSPDQKSVAKHKTAAKVLCCSWTNDGQLLALGLMNGGVTIRDKAGVEKVLIERKAPIWNIMFNPSRDEPVEVLAVVCWDRTLSFYQASGAPQGKERELKYDPCSIGYFSNGEYLCIGGSDRKVSLYTKEGVRLTTIGERDDWVWTCKARPNQNYVAVGCNDGTITMYQLIFSTVHGLYQDRYAYRDFMTDVIIQHLITEQKVRIKCRDYVKKIAVYKDRVAVQLPDKIIIYELSHDDAYDMHYRVREKLQKKLDCNLLVVTSHHIILCQEKKLQLYNFHGEKQREWVLESVIRYIKVVGGPSKREGILVGLKNGLVVKVFLDNQFPITLVKHTKSIRCLDLSMSRNKLAIVDENAEVVVYDVKTKEVLHREKDANSVAFNAEFEDMFAYSGNGYLSIKTGTFPLHQQKLMGFVVGFKGSKIFCLHYVAMTTIDVPQSASLCRYIEKKDFDNAYKIGCLGVTDSDWRMLGMEALSAMQFETARKAFIRVKDMRYIDLLNQIEQARKSSDKDDQMFLAEIYAYQGKYQEAAKIFSRIGKVEKAIDMFSDLRQWEEAKQFAATTNSVNVKDLIRRQAEWSEEIGDWKAAGEMYVVAGEFLRAINIYGERGWLDELIEVARTLSKAEVRALGMCATFFSKGGNHQFAKECYLKMGDNAALMALHLEFQKWDDAFLLLQSHPEYASQVYLPWAQWLACNDRFDEAQDAFTRAGKPDLALGMLGQLTHNAVVESRFADAGYYFWLLGHESLKMCGSDGLGATATKKHLRDFREYYTKAEIYYAYDFVLRATINPFTKTQIESLFNICRFLLNSLTGEIPVGVSKVFVIKTLAESAKRLEAYKLSRTSYDKLQTLRMPARWRSEKSTRAARWNRLDELELDTITVRSRPFQDNEAITERNTCYRCLTKNPLLNAHGDFCSNCRHKFMRCFVSFDQLPLVEFKIDDNMTDEDAMALIQADPPIGSKKDKKPKDQWVEQDTGTVQMMSFQDEEPEGGFENENSEDPFERVLVNFVNGDQSGPPVIDANMLKSFNKNDVFVKSWGPMTPCQYFRSVDAETPIILCPSCKHFFREEDYEYSVIATRKCPFCRVNISDGKSGDSQEGAKSKWDVIKEVAGDNSGSDVSKLAHVSAIVQKAAHNDLL